MENRFRYCPARSYGGLENMALDQLFLRERDDVVVRFYDWKRPTLSFGIASFRPEKIDLDYCRVRGIDLVKRPTGGKTVFHQHELTYSISSPLDFFPGGILASYQSISRILIDALSELGVRAEMKPEKKIDPSNNVCFSDLSAYEIRAEGKKLVGSAQRRNGRRLLQHGSILLKTEFGLWERIWKDTRREEFEATVIGLERLVPHPPDGASLGELLIRHFGRSLGRTFIPLDIDGEVLAKAEKFKKTAEIQ